MSRRSYRCPRPGSRTLTLSNRLTQCCLVLLTVHGATGFRAGSVKAQQPAAGSTTCANMVFSASDFPALAAGIEVRTSGEAVAQVWSPANQEWRLSQDGDTVVLHSTEIRVEPLPRWQKLGKVVLRAGHPLKVTVFVKQKPETDEDKDKDKDKTKHKDKDKAKPDAKTQDDPPAVPALLVLSTDSQADPERVLDLVRGRVDSAGPAPIAAARRSGRTRREPNSSHPPRPMPGEIGPCISVSRCWWRSGSGRCRPGRL